MTASEQIPHIWVVNTVGLTYKQKKACVRFFISKYVFSENDFCTITPHFLNPILKVSCNFSLQCIEYGKTVHRQAPF